MLASFITGSRAYGTPRADSDCDLVVRISPEDLETLIATAGPSKVRRYPDNDSASVRLGKLNLICLTSDDAYRRWSRNTSKLVEIRPVTRDEAIESFAAVGVCRAFDSAADDDRDEWLDGIDDPY